MSEENKLWNSPTIDYGFGESGFGMYVRNPHDASVTFFIPEFKKKSKLFRA